MKRTKKVFALLMSAIFAFSMVPAWAWADQGDMEDSTVEATGTYSNLQRNQGVINLANTKVGETYNVYRMFDLASFTDSNPETNAHAADTEAYSYVIDLSSNSDGFKWFTFLTTYGPNGSFSGTATNTNFPYAVYEDEENAIAKNNAYFLIERAAIKLNNNSNYHVVKPNGTFASATDYMGSATSRDNEGESAGDDLTASGSAIVQDFAQEALRYAMTLNGSNPKINPTYTATGSTTDPVTVNSDQGGTVKLGYYLVGTTMGTLASLDTTNRVVDIYEKNDEPSVEKKVLKRGAAANGTSKVYLADTTGEGAAWVEATDADVGDYVMFRTVITAQQGVKDYRLHDVMETGLTFVQGTPSASTKTDGYTDVPETYEAKVYLVRGTGVHAVPSTITVASGTTTLDSGVTLADGTYTNWSLKYIEGTGDSVLNSNDGCDFEIVFNDADGTAPGNDRVTFVATTDATGSTYAVYDIKDGDKIVVTYWAQVKQDAWVYGDEDAANSPNSSTIKDNSGAVLDSDFQQKTDHDGNQRNTNATVLTYGAKSHTAKDVAEVTTYQFDIAKTKVDSSSNHNLLAGAKFSLYKAKTTKNMSASPEDSTYTYIPTGDTAITYFYNETNEKLHFKQDGNSYLFQGDQPAFSTTTDVNQLVSADGGEMNVRGLESGTYILVEDDAPNGYNKLAYPIVVTVDDDDDWNANNNDTDGQIIIVSKSNANNGVTTSASRSWDATITGEMSKNYDTTSGGIEVVNQTGQELPSTGGIGTTIFYVVGGALVAVAAVVLVTKRRMGTEE